MALVISFVTDASKAVAEMKRVVKRHGTVAAYIGTRWVEASSKGPMAGAAAMLGAAVAWFAACAGGRDRDGEERSVLYGWWHQASWNGRRGRRERRSRPSAAWRLTRTILARRPPVQGPNGYFAIASENTA
jgi:hypothetical protein